MRLVKTFVFLLCGILLLSTLACGGGGPAGPTPTPTSTPTTDEGWYEAVKGRIQDAVIAYLIEHETEVPVTGGRAFIGEVPYNVVDLCLLIDEGLLPRVPAGCGDFEGDSNDNCDAGGCVCDPQAHYVWVVNVWGNVFSTCVGDGCNLSYANGFQDVWP